MRADYWGCLCPIDTLPGKFSAQTLNQPVGIIGAGGLLHRHPLNMRVAHGKLIQVVHRLGSGARSTRRLNQTIFHGDDRVYPQCRAQKGLGSTNSPASSQVLQGVKSRPHINPGHVATDYLQYLVQVGSRLSCLGGSDNQKSLRHNRPL